MKKRLIAICMTLLLVSGLAYASGLYNGYKIVTVKVDGLEVTSDVPAVLMDGRVVVPVRFVSEALGGKVDWDGATATVSITSRQIDNKHFVLAMDAYKQMDEMAHDIRALESKFDILTIDSGTDLFDPQPAADRIMELKEDMAGIFEYNAKLHKDLAAQNLDLSEIFKLENHLIDAIMAYEDALISILDTETKRLRPSKTGYYDKRLEAIDSLNLTLSGANKEYHKYRKLALNIE